MNTFFSRDSSSYLNHFMIIALAFFVMDICYVNYGYCNEFDEHNFVNNQQNGLNDRGLVAIPNENATVYVGWRLLKDDPKDIAFNLYRHAGNGSSKLLNDDPITGGTNFVDNNPPDGETFSYSVRPVINGNVGESSHHFKVKPKIGDFHSYLKFKLMGEYDIQKIGIADLDGEGRYDYVIKQPDVSTDPWYKNWESSQGTYKLEAFRA